METDTARLSEPTPCCGRVHRPARARGIWQRHRQAHAHDPVDDGNGPTGKITKLEHHVSGKTEPNKFLILIILKNKLTNIPSLILNRLVQVRLIILFLLHRASSLRI